MFARNATFLQVVRPSTEGCRHHRLGHERAANDLPDVRHPVLIAGRISTIARAYDGASPSVFFLLRLVVLVAGNGIPCFYHALIALLLVELVTPHGTDPRAEAVRAPRAVNWIRPLKQLPVQPPISRLYQALGHLTPLSVPQTRMDTIAWRLHAIGGTGRAGS